jgi:hypothetical protein
MSREILAQWYYLLLTCKPAFGIIASCSGQGIATLTVWPENSPPNKPARCPRRAKRTQAARLAAGRKARYRAMSDAFADIPPWCEPSAGSGIAAGARESFSGIRGEARCCQAARRRLTSSSSLVVAAAASAVRVARIARHRGTSIDSACTTSRSYPAAGYRLRYDLESPAFRRSRAP